MAKKDFAHTLGEIIFFGDTGSGKTTISSMILKDRLPGEEAKKSTKTLKSYSGFWQGKEDSSLIRVHDLPGVGDPDVKIDELLTIFEKHLKNKCLTALCFVFRADGHRVTAYHNASLLILRLLVKNKHPWNNIIIIGTHADKVDEISPQESVDHIRMKLNELELDPNDKSVKPQINRTVIFSKRDPNAGLEELKKHLMELRSDQIETTDKKPDENLVKKIYLKLVGGSDNCFAGDMFVRVNQGDKIVLTQLTDVKLFDMVQVNDGSFEPIMVLSRHIDQNALLLDFEAQVEGKNDPIKLSLVPGHYVYLRREGEIVHVPARKARIGDALLHSSKEGIVFEANITNIRLRSYHNTINIRTQSRTLIVNDLLCSSVVEGDAGIVGHKFSILMGKLNKKWPNQITQQALRFRAKMLAIFGNKEDQETIISI